MDLIRRIITSLITTAVLTYLGFGVVLYIFQDSMLYYPTAAVDRPYQERVFRHDGEFIHVIVVNQEAKKALIYFGGNAEAVANSALLYQQLAADYAVYLVEYRGYGKSSGTPSEAALFSDARYIYDQITTAHTSISTMGRSLGSGVAAYLASVRKIDKLALITPYDSILNIARSRYPLYPISLMLKDDFDTLSLIPQLHAPTLIIMAENDRIIPREHSLRVVQAFPKEQVQVKLITNANHNNITNHQAFREALQKFFGKSEPLQDHLPQTTLIHEHSIRHGPIIHHSWQRKCGWNDHYNTLQLLHRS